MHSPKHWTALRASSTCWRPAEETRDRWASVAALSFRLAPHGNSIAANEIPFAAQTRCGARFASTSPRGY
jgi:hypothetical protein